MNDDQQGPRPAKETHTVKSVGDVTIVACDAAAGGSKNRLRKGPRSPGVENSYPATETLKQLLSIDASDVIQEMAARIARCKRQEVLDDLVAIADEVGIPHLALAFASEACAKRLGFDLGRGIQAGIKREGGEISLKDGMVHVYASEGEIIRINPFNQAQFTSLEVLGATVVFEGEGIHLPNLKAVGVGWVYSKELSLPLLRKVWWDLNFFGITDGTAIHMPSLQWVEENLRFRNSNSICLPGLAVVKHGISIESSTGISAPLLKHTDGEISLRDCCGIQLPSLEGAPSSLTMLRATGCELPALKRVCGPVSLGQTNCPDLGALQVVKDTLQIERCDDVVLPSLVLVGNDLRLEGVVNLKAVELCRISRNLHAEKSRGLLLESLQTIEGVLFAHEARDLTLESLWRAGKILADNSIRLTFPKLQFVGEGGSTEEQSMPPEVVVSLNGSSQILFPRLAGVFGSVIVSQSNKVFMNCFVIRGNLMANASWGLSLPRMGVVAGNLSLNGAADLDLLPKFMPPVSGKEATKPKKKHSKQSLPRQNHAAKKPRGRPPKLPRLATD